MDKMDQNSKTQIANAAFQEAVDQCDEIENSLEGCLKVLQKIRMPFTIPNDNMECTQELCGKLSYTVCIGKKYPELIEIYDDEYTENSDVDSLVRLAGQKMEKILSTQETILQRLGIVEDWICNTFEDEEELKIISDQQTDSNVDEISD